MNQGIRRRARPVPLFQPKAVLSQANPVSTTEYPVTAIADVKFGRIKGIYAEITGGTVSELRVNCDIEDEEVDFIVASPVLGTPYFAEFSILEALNAQVLSDTDTSKDRAFLVEGRNITIKAACTWSVQPSPLQCEVIWGKW